MRDLAPIVLFVYNRLEHTKKTIEALQKNKYAADSMLFIFSDGAKKEQDIDKVSEIRKYIKGVTGFKSVEIVEREVNYGLAKSIVDGVTTVVSKYGKIIVLEDDIVTDDTFLEYMNEGLCKYQDNKQVYSVSGYSYLGSGIKTTSPYFLKICSSWSWATWSDRWEQFDTCCADWNLLGKERELRRKFDYDYAYPFYGLLKAQMRDEKTNSWAIKWYWTLFKNGGLTLYPTRPLVYNVGFDGSGEHCKQKRTRNMFVRTERKLVCGTELIEYTNIRRAAVKSIRKENSLGETLQIVKDMME